MLEFIVLPLLALIAIGWFMNLFDNGHTHYNPDGTEYNHKDPQGELDWRFWLFMGCAIAFLIGRYG